MTSIPLIPFLRRLAFLCLLAGIGAMPAQADGGFGNSINIDFGVVNDASPLYTGTGANTNDTGVIWNAASPDPSTNTVTKANLLDSVGHNTGVSISITNVSAVSTTGGGNPTNSALLQDYLVGNATEEIIMVKGLVPFGSYKVYLYGAGSESGQGATFFYGGESAATNGAARGDTFVQGVNYVTLNTSTHEKGVMTLGVSSNGALPAAINGIQIQLVAKPITTFPSFTDLFDVSQGTKITGGSPVSMRFPLVSGIGGSGSLIEDPTDIVFADGNPAGTLTYFDFQMPSVQTIQSINIFMNHDSYHADGSPGNIYNRGASRVTLWAYDTATSQYDIKAYEIFPSNPYALTLAPPGSAVQDTGSPYLLAVTANINPVTTDRFRMEFVQAGVGGPRFAELDGFSTLNPGLNAPVPVITTATTAAGQVGTAFSYQLAGSFTPSGYSADGLPAGLHLNTATGTITGTPTVAGTFDAAVTASNESGQGPVATLRFTIASAAVNIQGISILSPPTNINVVQNQIVQLNAAVVATASKLKQVQFLVIDAADNKTVLATSTVARPQTTWKPTATGTFALAVVATDILGQTQVIAQPIHILPASTAVPRISFLSGVGGHQFALGSSVEVIAAATDASGNPLPSVQFFLDGKPIPTTISVADSSTTRANTDPSQGGRRIKDAASHASLANAQLPLTGIEQLLTAAVTDLNGTTTVTPGVTIKAKAAPTDAPTFVFSGPDGTTINDGSVAPATVNVAASTPVGKIAKMEFFADATSVGVLSAAPYNFALPALSVGKHVFSAIATDSSNVSSASPPVIVNVLALPVVSFVPIVPRITVGSGDNGRVLVSIPSPAPTAIQVKYAIKGSATAGTDYYPLTGTVTIKPGHTSRKIVIIPKGDLGGASLKAVKLVLQPGSGYTAGTPTVAKVKIFAP